MDWTLKSTVRTSDLKYSWKEPFIKFLKEVDFKCLVSTLLQCFFIDIYLKFLILFSNLKFLGEIKTLFCLILKLLKAIIGVREKKIRLPARE